MKHFKFSTLNGASRHKSAFQLKQNLAFSPRTHRERFQRDPRGDAVPGGTHCPDANGRLEPKGRGLVNTRSCPHPSHLRGLQPRCSDGGIPGERGPSASGAAGRDAGSLPETSPPQPRALGNVRNSQGPLRNPRVCLESPVGPQ